MFTIFFIREDSRAFILTKGLGIETLESVLLEYFVTNDRETKILYQLE